MTERISLAEAYNNKDVVTQIAILKDKLDSIPDADLTNVVLKTGDQVIDGEKTFNDPIVANGGVVFANSGIHVNGTLEVDGDIIQNGSAYETHAEQVYSVNDLIVTRDGQITGLAPGDMSGFHVKKYNGVDDSCLGVDSTGTMRVGDVGSEQPLMTRDETADMTSGNLVVWDGVNEKAITGSTPSSDLVTSSAANVGDNEHPVKIVNHVPVAVNQNAVLTTLTINGMNIAKVTSGNIVMYSLQGGAPETSGDFILDTAPVYAQGLVPIMTGAGVIGGYLFLYAGNLNMRILAGATDLGFRAVYFRA